MPPGCSEALEQQGESMALTRKMLKAMGIDDDKADEIIDAHAETVSSLKKQVDDARASSGNAEALQKEVNELKEQLKAAGTDEYKALNLRF